MSDIAIWFIEGIQLILLLSICMAMIGFGIEQIREVVKWWKARRARKGSGI